MLQKFLMYTMFDFKLIVVACAAFFLVWRVFNKKKQQNSETEEDLFKKLPHDIVLSIVASGNTVSAKLRTSYKQNLVTIGRMHFNVLPLTSPLISSEHAVIKWNANENCWLLKDVGSMNGTRLNDEVISCENRKPSEEYPLRHGDIIILAEDIKLEVTLTKSEAVAGAQLHRPQTSPLRAAPRWGCLKARIETPRLMTARDHPTVPRNTQPMEQEEYYSDAIDAEFAVLTQVGVDHWHNASPSEDVVFWQLPFANFIHSGIFGVCDGHLGADASTAIPRLFPSILSDQMKHASNTLFSSSSCESYLRSAFLEVDSKLDTDAGSTATILLAEKAENGELCIQAANVGDSLGILINTNTGQCTSLTADHRVANEKERQRLQQLGNPVTKSSTRLYMLNLARAMGDTNLKKMNTALIAEPHVSPPIRIMPNKAHLIVMASDGLWDCVGQQEVAKLAIQAVQNWEGLRAFGNALIKLATQQRGARDDISVFLARF